MGGVLREVLRRPEVATDPRFATMAARRDNRRELTALIEDFFATMTSLEAVAVLDAAGIANGRLNQPMDVWNHEQFAARDKWREVGTPDRTGARAAAAVHLHRPGGGDGRRAVAGPAHR